MVVKDKVVCLCYPCGGQDTWPPWVEGSVVDVVNRPLIMNKTLYVPRHLRVWYTHVIDDTPEKKHTVSVIFNG